MQLVQQLVQLAGVLHVPLHMEDACVPVRRRTGSVRPCLHASSEACWTPVRRHGRRHAGRHTPGPWPHPRAHQPALGAVQLRAHAEQHAPKRTRLHHPAPRLTPIAGGRGRQGVAGGPLRVLSRACVAREPRPLSPWLCAAWLVVGQWASMPGARG